MEKHGGTTSLRNAASQWSLAGDKKLLELLQDIHEKVVTKCKETNSLLDHMITSLDETNIDIQTVNNKFMSLSNSQFVESRVYSDDADVSIESTPVKPVPRPPTPRTEVARIKTSLQILEDHHEVVEILPDTDSDSEDEGITSVVLKPKNVYAHRPLPYIIGTPNWRNKWHSGTIQSDSSDSSSSHSRSRSRQSQVSETESEHERWEPTPGHDDTLSSVSSEAPPAPPAPPALSPAEVANELARRLGNVTQVPATPYEAPKMDTTKIIKPEVPIAATIFLDEPPPLTHTYSDNDVESDDNDIFAELHRNNAHNNTISGNLGKSDLFKENDGKSDPLFESVFENNAKKIENVVKPVISEKRQQDLKPELFASKPQTQVSQESVVKKPMGGISLFGSNKGTESIGAAILKRNQRKSSSDEDIGSNAKPEIKTKPKPNINNIVDNNKPVNKTQKDIVNDLFAKSQKSNKKPSNKVETVKTVKEPEKKVDLFNDDLFDDIDDIFTTNIKSTAPKTEPKKQKSIFEEENDDDELFSEVTKPNKNDNKSTSSIGSKNKGLFDSDDELFDNKDAHINTKISKESNKVECVVNKPNVPISNLDNDNKNSQTAIKTQIKETKSIFDDSSDDDIFSSIEIKVPPKTLTTKNITLDINKELPKTDLQVPAKPNIESHKKNEMATSDLFNNNERNKTPTIANLLRTEEKKQGSFTSPSIIADEDDALFTNIPKNKTLKHQDDVNKNNMSTAPAIVDNMKTIQNYDIETSILHESDKVEKDIPSNLTINVNPDKSVSTESSITEEKENIVSEVEKLDPMDDVTNDVEERVISTDNIEQIISSEVIKDNKIESVPIVDHENEIPPNVCVDQPDLEDNNFEDNDDHIKTISVSEQEIQEKIKLDLEKSLEESLFLKHSEIAKQDVLSDIFASEPPAFEKPKEPKKSRDVNALFDDDSDDEALFFKKEDPILDEKPNIFESGSKPTRFGIFLDEPPDFDVDFTRKDEKIVKTAENTKPDITSLISDEIDSSPILDALPDDVKIDERIKETKVETKKIGKLKPMNLNINVSSLLPGASPKKVPKPTTTTEDSNSEDANTSDKSDFNVSPVKVILKDVETDAAENNEIDGQVISANSETLPIPKAPKAVGFDENPESNVLDNKLSKSRARIQVKRRPSSRRARHEAVRKSIKDNQEESNDSTDNSSSVDDQKTTKVQNIEANSDSKPQDEAKSDIVTNLPVANKDTPSLENCDVIETEKTGKTEVDSKSNNVLSNSNVKDTVIETKDVKSKVVYVLNDEDIFTNIDIKPQTSIVNSNIKDEQPSTSKTEQKPKILTIVDDDDEMLFKGAFTKPDTEIKDKNQPEKIKTETPKTSKASLFIDSSDDEELFKPKSQTNKKTVTIFGSDSDDDIFSGKKKKTKQPTVEVKKREKVVVKKSLFSDDDDDDLFGAKKKEEPKPEPSQSTSASIKLSQHVVDDPLSIFDDDYSV